MTFFHESSALFWHIGEGAAWISKAVATANVPQIGAHVWFIHDAHLQDLGGLVSETELLRAHEMLPASKAREFLFARATLRQLLAVYIQTLPPREICIAMTEHGKPYLPDHPALKFNLSHSHGALALAFSKWEVGIDIEKLRPVPDWQDLATGILSAKARANIAREPPAKQGAAFLQAFTAREALLKAAGTGFSSLDFPSAFMQHSNAAGIEFLAELPPLTGFTGHVCVPN